MYVIYSHPENPHIKPNEPKCVKYKVESARGFASRFDQKRIRGMPHRWGEEGGARTAIEGAET